MLKQLDVVYGTESGEQALILKILDATPKDSLLVRKVTGLEPPAINLFIGEYSRDGGSYSGRRVPPRNVVATVLLNPNYAEGESVSGLREMLYRILLDPQLNADYSQIILREDDGRSRYLVGYTEKIETDLFDVETLLQVSMICPDPFIRDLVATVFEDALGWITLPFTYAGTAETGFEAEIKITAATSALSLSLNGTPMVLTYPFLVDDVVYINTNRGERTITRTRAGITIPLIAQLNSTSPWLYLHSPANSLTIYGDIILNRPATITSFIYRASYWGV